MGISNLRFYDPNLTHKGGEGEWVYLTGLLDYLFMVSYNVPKHSKALKAIVGGIETKKTKSVILCPNFDL